MYDSYEIECNKVLGKSRCLKTTRGGGCPSGLRSVDPASLVCKIACKGRIFTPSGNLSKPNSFRLFESAAIEQKLF